MYIKYSEEMKEETAIYILESGKSITAASKELGLMLIRLVDGLINIKISMGLLVMKISQLHLMKCKIKSKI